MLALKIVLGIILACAALFIALVIFVMVVSLFADRNKTYSNDSAFYRGVLYLSTAIAVVLVRIKVHTSGLDRLPDGKFLMVSNHRSRFDPILTWHVMRRAKLAFISKPSNFKIPFFGRIIRKCCFMDIDRNDPRNAMKTINHAADLLGRGETSVGVYPEGTRNMTGETLLPFHDGLLRIAQKANSPVVVVCVRGTREIQHNYPWRRSHVYIDIIDVIPAETVRTTRTTPLGEQIRDEMKAHLELYK